MYTDNYCYITDNAYTRARITITRNILLYYFIYVCACEYVIVESYNLFKYYFFIDDIKCMI